MVTFLEIVSPIAIVNRELYRHITDATKMVSLDDDVSGFFKLVILFRYRSDATLMPGFATCPSAVHFSAHHSVLVAGKFQPSIQITRSRSNEQSPRYYTLVTTTTIMASQSEREFIQQGCQMDCRLDGRSRHEFRTYPIETAVLPLSNGSSRLLLPIDTCSNGIQQYLCSVKAELVQPSLQYPNAGSVEISVFCDGNKGAAQQAQAALQQSRVSWIQDLGQLCVVPGIAVWKLSVDLFLLSSTGSGGSGSNSSSSSNIQLSSMGSISLDAASHCIRAALHDTVLPSIATTTKSNAMDEIIAPSQESSPESKTNETTTTTTLDGLLVDSDIANALPLMSSIDRIPFIVTVHLIPSSNSQSLDSGNNTSSNNGSSGPGYNKSTLGSLDGPPSLILLLDASPSEVAVSTMAVHVVVMAAMLSSDEADDTDKNGRLACSVWKSGGGSIPLAVLPDCVHAAVSIAAPLALKHYRIRGRSSSAAYLSSTASTTTASHQQYKSQKRSAHEALFSTPIIIQHH